MALHLAVLEPHTPTVVGGLARKCAAVDASLHLVGPMPFALDDKRFIKAGPDDWQQLDWWLHPGWRDFRDAMARDRCIYFSSDAERPAEEAPFRGNSVLVVGTESGILPDRIQEKYPSRVFNLPMPPRKRKVDLVESSALLLETAGRRLIDHAIPGVKVAAKPIRYGRGRVRR